MQARLNELEEEIAHVRASTPRRRLRGAALGELQVEWDQLDLDEQRALLADHIEHIDVAPVGRGRHFDPDAITIHWRE